MVLRFRRLLIPLLLAAACTAIAETTLDLGRHAETVSLSLDSQYAGIATLHVKAADTYCLMLDKQSADTPTISGLAGETLSFKTWYRIGKVPADITFGSVHAGDSFVVKVRKCRTSVQQAAPLAPTEMPDGSEASILINIAPWVAESGSSGILLVGGILIGLAVVAAVGYLLLRAQKKSVQPPAQPPPPAWAVASEVRVSPEDQGRIRQDIRDLQLDVAGIKSANAAVPSLPDLSRFVEVSVFQDAIQETRGNLEKLRSGLRTEIPKLNANSDQVRQAVAKLEQDTKALRKFVETEFASLSAQANQNLSTAVRVLAQDFARDWSSATPSSDERALVAKRMDEALTSFFRQSVPSRDGLMQKRTWIQNILSSAATVRNELAPSLPEVATRLDPCIDEAAQIDKELEGMLEAAGNQRLRLNFQVDFSTSAASRESVVDGITAGLKTQIVKLEQPLEYFDRRIEAVALASARNAADFIDLKADEYRRDASLQRLLDQLIQTGRLEAIVPVSGESFRSAEHAVVQTVPADGHGSHTVARVVTRGFRQGGRVLRKASIILFE